MEMAGGKIQIGHGGKVLGRVVNGGLNSRSNGCVLAGILSNVNRTDLHAIGTDESENIIDRVLFFGRVTVV